MASKKSVNPDPGTIKALEEWTTGDEPMTGAQESYLHTLAREAGESVDDELTKAEASKMIDELQEKTGRGSPGPAARSRKKTARHHGS
jgi:hypothetical protein